MPPQANRFSVSQALEGFLLAKAAEGRSPKTLADYSYCLGMFAKWAQQNIQGDVAVSDLTTDDLRRFMAHLRQGTLSPKTLKNIHTALSSFWVWLGTEFGLPNLVKPIAAPKASVPALKLPSREDIATLLKACDQTTEARTQGRSTFKMKRPTALRDRCMVLVLVDCGLRAQELCGLAIKDVDMTSGSVLVRHAKGGKQRIVYLGKASKKTVWRYVTTCRQDATPGEPLFVTRDDRPLTVDHLSHVIADLGQRAGLKVWPHLLRHVFATEFLRGGGNLLALRRLLGHASNALLERYAEIVEADLQAAHATASPADRWKL